MFPFSPMTTIASGAESMSWRNSSLPSVSLRAMRQPDAEDGARRAILDGNAPAVRFDGEPAEGEPEATPRTRDGSLAALDLDEALEDGLAHRRGNPWPAVRYSQFESFGMLDGAHADHAV